MNAINLSGRLTHEPKLIHRGERAICEMRLAVDNGRYPTTYIDLRSFDGQAYACAEYLSKGSKVAVSGSLAYDEWRATDDSKRHRYSVIGRVEFLDPPPAAGAFEPLSPEPEASESQLALAA